MKCSPATLVLGLSLAVACSSSSTPLVCMTSEDCAPSTPCCSQDEARDAGATAGAAVCIRRDDFYACLCKTSAICARSDGQPYAGCCTFSNISGAGPECLPMIEAAGACQ